MKKSLKEVLEGLKGPNNVDAVVVTAKGPFSKAAFKDFVSAAINDPEYQFIVRDNEGREIDRVSIREKIVNDLKKTYKGMNYPQESEAAIIENGDIFTDGLSDTLGFLLAIWMAAGKKFPIPSMSDDMRAANVYLVSDGNNTRVNTLIDRETKKPIGKIETVYQPYTKVKVDSKAPTHLQTKTRFDLDGNVITESTTVSE
ncbi:MAG: hypothetical protein HDQ88_10225 [Clostridia bacterium]|nr:hypothetical protein [Clostridia bacterium]